MLGRQPVLWMAVFTALILTLKEFGLQDYLTPGREVAINTLVIAVMALITRQQVTPSVTIREDPEKALRDNNIHPETLQPFSRPAAVVLLVFGLSGALALTPACALKGKPPERQLALIGIQVVDGLRNAGTTAQQLHAAKVITDAQYKAFLTRSKEAFDQADRLADALRAYDQVASQDTATQVQGALNALAVLVPKVGADLGGAGGAKIAELIGEVNKLILSIAQAVRPPTAALRRTEWRLA